MSFPCPLSEGRLSCAGRWQRSLDRRLHADRQACRAMVSVHPAAGVHRSRAKLRPLRRRGRPSRRPGPGDVVRRRRRPRCWNASRSGSVRRTAAWSSSSSPPCSRRFPFLSFLQSRGCLRPTSLVGTIGSLGSYLWAQMDLNHRPRPYQGRALTELSYGPSQGEIINAAAAPAVPAAAPIKPYLKSAIWV